jgi:hypothetical protein
MGRQAWCKTFGNEPVVGEGKGPVASWLVGCLEFAEMNLPCTRCLGARAAPCVCVYRSVGCLVVRCRAGESWHVSVASSRCFSRIESLWHVPVESRRTDDCGCVCFKRGVWECGWARCARGELNSVLWVGSWRCF